MSYSVEDAVEQREATSIIVDVDAALDQLPPEELVEYERCQASIVEARRHGQGNEGRTIII